jgi:hypothetical protein
LLASTFAHAQIYRWVDEQGVTVYSNTPPPSGGAQRIKPPPPPAEDPEQTRQRMEARRQAMDDLFEDRELAQQKFAQERKRMAVRNSNCQGARANLEKLATSAQSLVRLPDGSYVRFTEEERQQRMLEAQNQINRSCR